MGEVKGGRCLVIGQLVQNGILGRAEQGRGSKEATPARQNCKGCGGEDGKVRYSERGKGERRQAKGRFK